MRNTVVFGAGGFVGAELLRLIACHPDLELAAAVSDSHAGRAVSEVHPQLAGWTGIHFTASGDWALDQLEKGSWTVFSALGHGATMERLPAVLELAEGNDVQVIDLSGDFRLRDPEQYQRYYGNEHTAPELLDGFVYGLPELHREAIVDADRVANPGCFATAVSLALIPAAASPWPVVCMAVDGMTGSSGAGVQLRPTTHHPHRAHNIEAYRPLDHQHIPEVLQAWRAAGGGAETPLSFVPHRTPLVRGIAVSAHLFLDLEVKADEVFEHYSAFYADAPFVRVISKPPAVVDVWGSNRCDLSVTASGRMVSVCTAIDNLVKGAAGQAVQNANLMNGLGETTGLLTPMPTPV